ncbi:MAG: hypothetical protein R2838_08715 [Caldilineaceae bacterium]
MLARANSEDLAVTGVVADIFAVRTARDLRPHRAGFHAPFRESRACARVGATGPRGAAPAADGYLCIFIHKAPRKGELRRWLAGNQAGFAVMRKGYIDYTYKEQASGFASSFQFFMLIVQHTA